MKKVKTLFFLNTAQKNKLLSLYNTKEREFETLLRIPLNTSISEEGGNRIRNLFKLDKKRIKGSCLEKLSINNSYTQKPLVTIITAVFNSRDYLEDTIKSVLRQSYENIEYIIIDGGSTDGSLDIIKQYDAEIDYWVSEKDQGIADAWNKGLKLSTGSIIGLLNADDIYDVENVQNIINTKFKSELFIAYGRCIFLNKRTIVGENKGQLNTEIINGFGFVHTTCFKSRSVYEKIGLFNSSIRIAIDTEFLMRCLKMKVHFQKTDVLTYMEINGLSDKKFLKAQFEFLSSGLKLKLFNPRSFLIRGVFLIMFFPFRKLLKWEKLKNIKHLMFHFWNLLYNHIPTFFLKNHFLNLFGIKLGKFSYIHSPVRLYRTNNLVVGTNSVINKHCLLDNRECIKIGNSVSIAHDCKIYTCGHNITSPFFEIKCGSVYIGDFVSVFSSAMIMPGVTIGEGAVILPGSVVTKDVENFSIVGGVPAKHIRFRPKPLLYKLNYGWWHAQ